MNEFTNSAGKVYKVKPFPPLLNAKIVSQAKKEWEEKNGAIPSIPQYHVTTAQGKVEHFDLAQDMEKTPEQQKDWDEYVQKINSLENVIENKRAKAAILCLDVDPMQDTDWISRMRYLGIDIPTDHAELLDLYARTDVFAKVGQDALMLLMTASAASGIISQEVVTSLQEQFFRKNQRDAAGRTAETSADETEEGR